MSNKWWGARASLTRSSDREALFGCQQLWIESSRKTFASFRWQAISLSIEIDFVAFETGEIEWRLSTGESWRARFLNVQMTKRRLSSEELWAVQNDGCGKRSLSVLNSERSSLREPLETVEGAAALWRPLSVETDRTNTIKAASDRLSNWR